MKRRFVIYFLLFLMLLGTACKKPYDAPAVTTDYKYLVIDGVINANSGGITTIQLSRTKRLSDTILINPELNARINIESENGVSYALNPGTEKGQYQSAPLFLNNALKYRLRINTSDGNNYASEFVPIKISPAIDSVTWEQDQDVSIYGYTHDPQNKTQYYRWDYIETWQYRANYNSSYGVNNRRIFFHDSLTQLYNCWGTVYSSDIVIGSTVALSEDRISKLKIRTIPQHDPLIGVKYSILVKQYALTKEAYQYWEILRRNTQQTGSIFDPQPSQLKGNFFNLNNPSEPVIGFLTASSITEKRIFIDNADLQNWVSVLPGGDCSILITQQNPADYLQFNYLDTSYAPYYFITGGGLAIARNECLDCTRRGGTNRKPLFWP